MEQVIFGIALLCVIPLALWLGSDRMNLPSEHRHTCPSCTVMFLCDCPSIPTEHRECPNCSGSRRYFRQWLTT